MWLYLIDYHMSVIANKVFSQFWYDLINGGSYFLYASHYVWIAIIY